ncbi:MAG: GNAT family N-acetyltransferase [Pseudomonadota bacterium]
MILRLATPDDREGLLALVEEMGTFWWGSVPGGKQGTAASVDAILGQSATCEALVAEDAQGRLVALATFALLQVAPSPGGTLFMKDLFVSERHRSDGLGQRMMSALARLAQERDCVRFDWTAETDNPRAIALYNRLGAQTVTEKVYFRFTGDALAEMAGAA